MGLSASQSRLLSLTSRLSNLELKSQSISNSKIRLADASTDASERYNTALSKQKLNFATGYDENGTVYSEATAENVTAYNTNSQQRFLQNSYGQIMVSDDIAAAYEASNGSLEAFINGQGYSTYNSKVEQMAVLQNGLSSSVASDIQSILGSGYSAGKLGTGAMFADTSSFDISSANATALASAKTAKSTALNSIASLTSSNSGNNVVSTALGSLSTALGSLDATGVTSAASAVLSTAKTATTAALNYSKTPTTANGYNDNEIMSYLSKLTSTNSAHAYTADIDTADVVSFGGFDRVAGSISAPASHARPVVAPADQPAQSSADGIKGIGSKVLSFISKVTNDVSGALYKTDDNYSLYAVEAAMEATRAFYSAKINKVAENYKPWNGFGSYVAGTAARAKTTLANGDKDSYNSVIYSDGDNTLSLDTNQIIKTFLNYYDAYKSSGKSYAQQNYTQSAAYSTESFTTVEGGGDATYGGKNGASSSERGSADNAELLAKYKTELTNLVNKINFDSLFANASDPKQNGMEVYQRKVSMAKNPSTNANYTVQDMAAKLTSIKNALANSKLSNTTISNLIATMDTCLGYCSDNNLTINEFDQILAKLSTSLTSLNTSYTSENTTETIGLKYDSAAVTYYKNLFNAMGAGRANNYSVIGDDEFKSADWLYAQLESGNMFIAKYNENNELEQVSYKSGDSSFVLESDKVDLAKAEAEYESTMNEIQSKDKRFDLQLKTIDTEHNAVQTEMDSVQKVLDKNIERTLKQFDA